jgi:8-oxo-dGTP pyrophosphatase MutT (NUDIX family)
MSPTPPTADAVVERLRRAANRTRGWFQRRLDAQALDIARLYASQRDRFVYRVGQVYQAYLGDEPTLLRARQGGAGFALDQAISDTTSALGDELGAAARTHLADTLDQTPAQLRRTYGQWANLDFADLPDTTQRVLGELTTAVVGGGTFFDRTFNVTDDLRHTVTRTIRSSLINGDDFSTLRGRLMKAFGVDKLAEPSGPAYGSVRVYRNSASAAFSKLMSDVADDSGGVQVWWATLDDSTTPGCAARHGKKISEVGDLPPRHTNCRCGLLIVSRGTDLSDYLAEAEAWLADNGYSRRQAARMESEREAEWDPAKHPRAPGGSPAGGQFSSGSGGGGAGGDGASASGGPDAEHKPNTATEWAGRFVGGRADLALYDWSHGVAERAGWPGQVNLVQGDGPEFTIGGGKFEAAGAFYNGTDVTQVYLDDWDQDTLEGVIAHEATHGLFKYGQQELTAQTHAVSDLARVSDPAVTGDDYPFRGVNDDRLVPELRDQFPLLFAYRELDHEGMGRVAASGSLVSPYAAKWWQAWRDGKAMTDQAMSETTAEIGKLWSKISSKTTPEYAHAIMAAQGVSDTWLAFHAEIVKAGKARAAQARVTRLHRTEAQAPRDITGPVIMGPDGWGEVHTPEGILLVRPLPKDAREAYNPNQPRVPGGSPAGGQFASGGGSHSGGADGDSAPDASLALETPDAGAFIAARNRTTRPGFLSPLDPGDLADRRMFMTADGAVGFALDPHEDIENLFNNGGPKGAGREAMFAALGHGGQTLDCYNGFLADFYAQFGFQETGRMRFNRGFAPPGWNFERDDDPDVIFMARTGPRESTQAIRDRLQGPRGAWHGRQNSDRYVDDWDTGKADARRAIGDRPRREVAGSGLGGRARRVDPGAGSLDRRTGRASEALAPIWAWGRWRLLPLFHVLPGHLTESRHPAARYHACPWSRLPAVAAGNRSGPWVVFHEAHRAGGPGDVLLRLRADGRRRRIVDVLSEQGWVPVVPTDPKAGRWIPVPGGRALDGIEGSHWQPRAQRPPLDVIEAWPGLREVALPAADRWRVAVVGPEQAEAIALEAEWDPARHKETRDFSALVREALTAVTEEDPYLVVGTPELAAVISCLTGRTLYARETFAPGLTAPYQRAACAVFEGEGLVWAVKPRDKAVWVLPGGHIDPEERPVDAAIRETREEAGLTVTGLRFMGRLYTPASTTHVFACRRDGEPERPTTPDEIEDVQLVALDDLVQTDRAFLLRHRRSTEIDLFHQSVRR